MIYTTIDNAAQFRDAFKHAGRGEQFSYEALGLLFDFLNDMGEDCQLDVIGICCEFSEASPEQICIEHGLEVDEATETAKGVAFSYLEDNTLIVGETDSGTIIYQQF